MVTLGRIRSAKPTVSEDPGEEAACSSPRNGPSPPCWGDGTSAPRPPPARRPAPPAASGPTRRAAPRRAAGPAGGGGQGRVCLVLRTAVPPARRPGGLLPALAPGERPRRADQRRVRPGPPQAAQLRGRRARLPLVAVPHRPPPHDRP